MQERCQGGTHDPGTHQHSVVSIHSTESPSPSVWINLDGRMPTLGENVLIPAMSSETMPLTSENVEKVLDELRPFLMADGGNVEVVEIDGAGGEGTSSRSLRQLPQQHHDPENGHRTQDARIHPGSERSGSGALKALVQQHRSRSCGPSFRLRQPQGARQRPSFADGDASGMGRERRGI